MHWPAILILLLAVLGAAYLLYRATSPKRRRRTPHTYIPPCIEK